MADKAQIIAQIRFAFEQLAERNAAHDWEHICRHLARSRLCSNILPATGPVQAGGDQGRDFETFTTFLKKNGMSGRSFVGLISDQPIAFACSIEDSKRIQSKIRNDVVTIMSSGIRPKTIYHFCTSDIAIAKRHALEEWAKSTFEVSLQILDAAAISELLCDNELSWLAERYLNLDAELFKSLKPERNGDDAYSESLERWRQYTESPKTFAHFLELRFAARTALGPFSYDEKGHPIPGYQRPELGFWIEKLDQLAANGVFPTLCRKAFYEACVIRLRGLGSLIGQENGLRLYFSGIDLLDDISDIENAQALLTYVISAARLAQVQLERAELEKWADLVDHFLRRRLRNAKKFNHINEQCALLEIIGYCHLSLRMAWGKADVDEALKSWGKLTKLVEVARLFPLERFADRLAQFAAYIGKHKDYATLTHKVDELLTKRFGKFKAAEKCLDRAIAFKDADDLPSAIAELHRAKIDWFAEETFEEALFALNCITKVYAEQGLHFAAKYYALAGAYMALKNVDLRQKHLVAKNLFQAASADYVMGAWYGFFELADKGAVFYSHFSNTQAADFEKHGDLNTLSFHLIAASACTKILYPQIDAFAESERNRILSGLSLAEPLHDSVKAAEAIFVNKGPEMIWSLIEAQLASAPWSDSGTRRSVEWRAHGVTWGFSWDNDYETCMAAEEVLAALQILLSDLAGQDLCLMKVKLEMSIELAVDARDDELGTHGPQFIVRLEPSNTEQKGTITLPPYRFFRDGILKYPQLRAGVLSIAITLLADSSLLAQDRFQSIMNQRFSDGLASKLHVGATFGRCFQEFVDKEKFEKSNRSVNREAAFPRPFDWKAVEKLPWINAAGPNYDAVEAKKLVRNRYVNFHKAIKFTLPRLSKQPSFQATVVSLRKDGWKDWHILSAVYHVVMHFRLNNVLRKSGRGAERIASQALPFTDEKPDATVVPVDEFDEVKLRDCFRMFLPAFAKTYGLQMSRATPNFAALEEFLEKRYNFWTDDIEHEDPFK